MVEITPEAEKFLYDVLKQNDKSGYGILIYVAGFASSGPQFGMSFQNGAKDGDIVDHTSDKFEIFYDEETKEELDKCIIEFIDDPNFGAGLTIRNPNFDGCAVPYSGYNTTSDVYDDSTMVDDAPKTINEEPKKSKTEEKPVERKKEIVTDNNKDKLNSTKDKLKGLFKSKK